LKIAVVGSGAAGLTAAHLLDPVHQVTLFEKADRFGGHTHTVFIPEGPDAGTPVDTGFIVFNQKNYPLLCRLFERLGVATESSDMAFGLTDRHSGLEYCSDFPKGLFAQKRNLLNPAFLRMIADILRINKKAKAAILSAYPEAITLREWIQLQKPGREFSDWYLLPMGAAIWSMPASEMQRFPAAMFLRFFENHGLWDLKNRPQWRFVTGGSQSYIKKIQSAFRGEMRLSAGVIHIRRSENKVTVRTDKGLEDFDAVVLAAHADETFAMLEDPSEEERKALADWKYTQNEAILHWDEMLMPNRRSAWASWNCHIFASETVSQPAQPVALTYWMNRLQKLKTKRDYFVTLNAADQIDPRKIIRKINYTHPHYDFAALASQKKLPSLNGKRNTYFCGSYFGNGFHEDAVRSAVQAADLLGAKL